MQKKYTVKGFVHVKCPICGEEKGFYAKKDVDGFHCFKCGKRIPFTEELKVLRVRCECGGYYKYRTNRTEKMFDVKCLTCETPVAVVWNQKKNYYETIE